MLIASLSVMPKLLNSSSACALTSFVTRTLMLAVFAAVLVAVADAVAVAVALIAIICSFDFLLIIFWFLIFGYQCLLHSTMYYVVLQYAINVLLCITSALHLPLAALAAVTAGCAN